MNLQPTILYKYFMGKKVELEERDYLFHLLCLILKDVC